MNSAIGSKFGISQAVIHVGTAKALNQLLSQMHLFQRAVRTDEAAYAFSAVVSLDLRKAVGHVFQGNLPVHGLPFPALLQHRRCQSICTVQRLIRKAVPVSDPAFIDGFVFKGHYPHHLVALDLDNQIRTS